jgi:hypothetical protein
MKAQTKALNISQINNILKHNFKTKLLINSGNCVGYIVKLDRCILPVTSQATEVSGADIIAMLAKLNDWEQTIEEVRQGLLQIIEEQLQIPQ